MTREVKGGVLLMVLGMVGCAEPPASPAIPIEVTLRSVDGAPVSGIDIRIDDVVVGSTDENGRLSTVLTNREGRPVTAEAMCKGRYAPVEASEAAATLRYMEAMEGGGAIPISLALVCEPLEQSIVLLVSTDNRSGLPIKAGGKTVAWTDADGVAQQILTGKPGDEIEVVLDTTSTPYLRPESPSRRLRIPMSPQVLVFEQAFKEEKPKPKRKRKKAAPVHVGPKRI